MSEKTEGQTWVEKEYPGLYDCRAKARTKAYNAGAMAMLEKVRARTEECEFDLYNNFVVEFAIDAGALRLWLDELKKKFRNG